MTARSIPSKIISFSVASADGLAPDQAGQNQAGQNQSDQTGAAQPADLATQMNEHIARGDVLQGRTYKISKSPASEHALYVTMNDIVLDPGTAHERRMPFEIFINSKNMDQFQWVVAMTRIISAVFRKGGDVAFLVEEMKSVFDPHGGYFRPGGRFVPSLVAEIGHIIEMHLQNIGLMEAPELDEAQKALIAEKRAKLGMAAQPGAPTTAAPGIEANESQFPPNATLCTKCHQKSTVIMDGCATCLNCGASKCG